MRDERAEKTKETLFVDQSRCKDLLLLHVATLCSFEITELFSFMNAKKSPSDFIKFLLFWSTLKTFDIKQGWPITEQKEIPSCTWSRANNE